MRLTTTKHRPWAPRSLHLERLEQRLPLAVDVSGVVFWDANRNGLNDDPAVSHESVTVSLEGHFFADWVDVMLSGNQANYLLDQVEDETFNDAVGGGNELADIQAFPPSGFQVTGPLTSFSAGGFSFASVAGRPISRPSWVEAADLDGINGPDLIVANFSEPILTILLNNGSGGFVTRVEIAVPVNATSIATADFDADGDIDLAVGNRNTSLVTVLVNQGGGTFTTLSLQAGGSDPFSVAARDVNADGKPDLVSSNFYNHTLSVYLNQSTTTQVSFAPHATIDAGNGSDMVVAADLKGQPGLPSLVVLNPAVNKLLIFDNDGQGGFTYSGDQNSVSAGGSRFITAGRIDGDAFDDIARYSSYASGVDIRFGDGLGGFVSLESRANTSWSIRGLALADMDGDGDLDIVANLIDGRAPGVMINEGNRQFSEALRLFDAPLDPVVASPPALADFDGDGVVDIAYSPKWQGGTVNVEFRQISGRGLVVHTNAANVTNINFGIHRIVTSTRTAAGDYDGSGVVDALDYAVWKANFGRTAGPGMSADGNGDRIIDAADYTLWRDNLGAVVAGATLNSSPAALSVAAIGPAALYFPQPVVAVTTSGKLAGEQFAPAPASEQDRLAELLWRDWRPAERAEQEPFDLNLGQDSTGPDMSAEDAAFAEWDTGLRV